MKTEDPEYAVYLKENFLPGRRLYLEQLLYPRYMMELPDPKGIWDLGCGFGEFLLYCRKKGIPARGIDSNPQFVASLAAQGLKVAYDDIRELATIPDEAVPVALVDNVLEHLGPEEIRAAFRAVERKLAPEGTLLVVVPGEKGFARDKTHRTYLDERNITAFSAETALVLEKTFRYPLDCETASRHFYLNMTLLKFRKRRREDGAPFKRAS